MLQKLCGPDALQNLLLTTTQWSNVDRAEGERREFYLRDRDACQGLVSKGASVVRFVGTRESGLELIRRLMLNEPKPLAIQDQIVNKNMTTLETDAGQFIHEGTIQGNIERLERQLQRRIRGLSDETKVMEQEPAKTHVIPQKPMANTILSAALHAAQMKRLETGRKKEEERDRSERAVIAVDTKDISVTAHLKSMFTPYNTKGRLIYDIDNPREFLKGPINITIHYQSNTLAEIEVWMKTIAEFFDAGMGVNNYISHNGALYQCKAYDCVKRGSQKFVIFRKALPVRMAGSQTGAMSHL